jgi:hypothetical protein
MGWLELKLPSFILEAKIIKYDVQCSVFSMKSEWRTKNQSQILLTVAITSNYRSYCRLERNIELIINIEIVSVFFKYNNNNIMSVSSTQITIRLFAGWVFLLLGLLQAVPRTQSFHVSSSSSTRNSRHASLILSSPSAKNIGRRINQNDNQRLPLFMVEENDVTDSEPPVIPVKCPDCNKCDGSGRYATKIYNYSSRKRKTDRSLFVFVFWLVYRDFLLRIE